MKKNLNVFHLCLVILFVFSSGLFSPLAAETKPEKPGSRSDRPVIIAESNRISCQETAKYLVVTKEVQGELGTDFLIKYKSNSRQKFPCHYIPGQGDFEIKNEWAEYFAGLKGDLLILDSTTGPGPSGLTIWDLKKRKKVYEGSWSDPEKSKRGSLVYWMETGEANYNNCPELRQWESNGLGAAIETRVILNLSNFKTTKTRRIRCSPRQ